MIRKLALLAGAAFIAKKWLDQPRDGGIAAKDRSSGQAGTSSPGHAPTDLLGHSHPDGSMRADEHFRPDPTAAVSDEDREGLRPVTFPAPHDPPGR